MAKKKTSKDEKDLTSIGVEPNEREKTPQEKEIERLLALGKVVKRES